jgi:hypothetical protein
LKALSTTTVLLLNLSDAQLELLSQSLKLRALQRRQEGRQLLLLRLEDVRTPPLTPRQLVHVLRDLRLIDIRGIRQCGLESESRFAFVASELCSLLLELAIDSLEPTRILVV